MVTNCTLSKSGIEVPGIYEDPRFTLNAVDVSCDNGNNGSIATAGLQNGRSPFTYSIVAPSPMGVGTSNSSGIFPDLNKIIVERKTNDGFIEVGKVIPVPIDVANQYSFVDTDPAEQNFYRIKLMSNNDSYIYSKIIFLQKQNTQRINIYPNPAIDIVNIDLNHSGNHVYKITLLNILNQKIKEFTFHNSNGGQLQIHRSKEMSSGMYILRITNTATREEFSQKIIFRPK